LAPGGSGLEPDAVKQITNACALPVAWSAVKKLLAERDVALLSAGLDEVPGVQNRMGELRPCGQGDQFSQRQSTARRSRSAPAPAASRSTRIASHETVSIRPVEFTFNHRDLENIGALPLPN
jgi:hypothetical protein